MGVGNLLAIRAQECAREVEDLPEQEAYRWKHGLATLLLGALVALAAYGAGVIVASVVM
jgi:hypothetical protein